MDIKTRVGHVLNFLGNQKYALDVYQRGYVWTDREIRKFLTDLEDHAVDWIADLGAAPPWFLGTVIVERRGGVNYLVDGQQRVVTLGLLLLALQPLADKARRGDIELALRGENKTLALPVAVGRYQLAFAALARGKGSHAFEDRDEDQQRIAAAFLRIKDWIETSTREDDYPALIEGVLRHCKLNIVTVSDTDLAYRLFNSLNSRGKPLSTIEALKSVLLSDLEPDERADLAAAWDAARAEAEAGGGGDPTLQALQSALIARAAPATQTTAFAASRDVKAIRENPFHWLTSDGDDRPPAEQVARELPFFMKLDVRLAAAVEAVIPGAEALHFIDAVGLPLEHWAPIVMAPLTPLYADAEENARKAAAAVAFLDIAAARLTWRPAGAATPAQARDLLAGLAPHLRDTDPESLALRLAALLQGHAPEPFGSQEPVHVGGDGLATTAAHAILARLTAFFETFTPRPAGDYSIFAQGAAGAPTLTPLIDAAGSHQLATAMDRLGAHVLTPRETARALADARTAQERSAALEKAGNALAALAADLTPRARAKLEAVSRGLEPPFGAPQSIADIDARERFYAALAQDLWSTERIMDAAADPNPRLVAALGLGAG